MMKILSVMSHCCFVLAFLFLSASANAQWVQTSGPYGGIILCGTKSGNSLLVGTNDGGVYVSNDNGASWRPTNSGITSLSVRGLSVAGGIVFAGTLGGGVFSSTDNGATWSPTNIGISDGQISGVMTDGTNVFAWTQSGSSVYRSTNLGKTWSSINSGLPQIRSLQISGTKLFATTGNNYGFISTDAGTSWTQYKVHGMPIITLVGADTHLLAFTLVSGADSVFVSSDGGTTWASTHTTFVNSLLYAGDLNTYAAIGSNLFLGTNSGLFLSTDNGKSWAASSAGLPAEKRTSSFVSAGNDLLLCSSAGIFRSADKGQAWTKSDSGIVLTQPISMASNGTTLFVGTAYSGLFRSTNNGGSWTPINNGLTESVVSARGCFCFQGSKVYSVVNGRVFFSFNNGSSWAPIDSQLTGLNSVESLTAKGSDLWAGTENGPFLSPDSGRSWYSARIGLPTDFSFQIPSISSTASALLLGTNDGIYRSTDNGSSWKLVLGSTSYVNSFCSQGTEMFVGTQTGVYASSDNGGTWQFADSGLVFALSTIGLGVFSGRGNSGGVHMTSDGGRKWTSVSDGLTNAEVLSLVTDAAFLYVGTSGGGIWRRSLSQMLTTGVNHMSGVVPKDFALDQNYPNPFNPSTVISFALPTRSFVTLKIFDVTGKEVTTLLSEELPGGKYSRIWNSIGFPSGVYFYRLVAGSLSDTKKLLVLR